MPTRPMKEDHKGQVDPLGPEQLRLMHAWWRAANYLSVGQVYLLANPLLREPLKLEHVKPRLAGALGHDARAEFHIRASQPDHKGADLNILFIAGPGHGAPGVVANTWLEGTYSELYPDVSQDEAGMCRLFRQFSFPGGIPSHAAPQTPGSIHEGGELGYSLSHAYGAVFDNPDLIVACVIGDGEAETGPLATSWHGNKFLNPVADGAVLPILHLNGYKIANPTVLARISSGGAWRADRGYGYDADLRRGRRSRGDAPEDGRGAGPAFAEIRAIQQEARAGTAQERPLWPMIVLRSPKGWTGPKTVDGLRPKGSWRAHQVPFTWTSPSICGCSKTGCTAIEPEELVRRNRTAAPGNRGAGAQRQAPHERQSACQWRLR